MDIRRLHIDLQTSHLAPLFVDLQKTRTLDGKNGVVVELALQPALPGDNPMMLIVVEQGEAFRFVVPKLAKSKEYQAIARIGHLNHQTIIPKLCWDATEGEISAEWFLFKVHGQVVTPAMVEFTLVQLLSVAYHTKASLAVALAHGSLPEPMVKQMADAAEAHLTQNIYPHLKT